VVKRVETLANLLEWVADRLALQDDQIRYSIRFPINLLTQKC
jgi:hypothetical protein